MILPRLSDQDLLKWIDKEIDIITYQSSEIPLSEGQINITLKRLQDKRNSLIHLLSK
jgi:hypothetical protein